MNNIEQLENMEHPVVAELRQQMEEQKEEHQREIAQLEEQMEDARFVARDLQESFEDLIEYDDEKNIKPISITKLRESLERPNYRWFPELNDVRQGLECVLEHLEKEVVYEKEVVEKEVEVIPQRMESLIRELSNLLDNTKEK